MPGGWAQCCCRKLKITFANAEKDDEAVVAVAVAAVRLPHPPRRAMCVRGADGTGLPRGRERGGRVMQSHDGWLVGWQWQAITNAGFEEKEE